MLRRFMILAGLLLLSGAAFGATILSYNFDGQTTLSGWTRSSTTYALYYTGATKIGTGAAQLKYNGNISRTVSTVGYQGIVLTCKMAKYSLDTSSEKVVAEYSVNGGSTWVIGATRLYNSTSSSYSTYTVNLPGTADNNANVKIRFRVIGSAADDYGYIEDVVVTGTAFAKSLKAGMGAIPYAGGVTFRVWAPNAASVCVGGDWNGWSATASKLVSEGNGYWSGDILRAVANQQYKYVIVNGTTTLWKNDPYARELTTSVGNSIIKDRAFTWGAFSMPSWGSLVIYELHTKTFNGTFAGITAKASYLKDSLALNCIQVMPAAEFPGDYSWGYNPSHLFAPESSYGGYTAYKTMINTMHANGIAVIQDIVHNHYGPSDLDLWCFDGPNLGNGGIYFYTDYRKVTPWGDSRPDYGRAEVRSFIKDNAIYWLEEMNADGLRWDATVYIRKTAYDGTDIPDGYSVLQYAHNEKNARFSWKISIAEDLQNNSWVTKTTGEGGAGFDSQWHANFLHSIRDQVKKGNDADRDMNAVKTCIDWIDNGNATKLVKYSESHDECAGNNGKQRLTQDIDTYNATSYWAKKRAGLAGLLAILSPGVPMIWQGQENLETGNWSDTKNFSWADTVTYAGYVAMYRDAIKLKRNWNNNTKGLSGNNVNVFHVNNTAKVIAFQRWANGGVGDDVIVVMNFGNTQYASYNIGAPAGGTWYCRYNSDWNGYSADFGNYGGYNTTANAGAKDGLGYNMNVGLGGYGVLILSR